jgi:hypothetical protein
MYHTGSTVEAERALVQRRVKILYIHIPKLMKLFSVQLFACLALSHACFLLTTVNPFDTIPTPFAYCATLRFAGGDLTHSASRPYSRQALSTLPLFVRIARVSWVPTALTVSRYCKHGMSTLFAYHTSVRSLTLVLKLPSSPRSSPCLKATDTQPCPKHLESASKR